MLRNFFGALGLFLCVAGAGGAEVKLPGDLPGQWEAVGRGKIAVTGSTATIEDGFLMSRDAGRDYEVSFSARAPEGTAEVQIWGGIRCPDRDNRYAFGLRGGKYDEMYLARYAPEGNAEFLGFAPLEFKPKAGVWYRVRAAVAGNRIQLYLGDEKLPRLNAVDKHPLWQRGGVVLGGGWLPAEFANLKVEPLTGEKLAAFNAVGDAVWEARQPDKESVRVEARGAYTPIEVKSLNQRSVSLDGGWLFMPAQDLPAGTTPTAVDFPDREWHTIPVPSYWNYGLDWLYGEDSYQTLRDPAKGKGIADDLECEEFNRLNAETFDWRKTQSGWYREYFDLPENIEGKHFEIDFDAIAKAADIWLNGVHVGAHTGMFGEVRCDVTGAARPGSNVLTVRCVAMPSEFEHGTGKVKGVAVTVEVNDKMLNSLPHHIIANASGGGVGGIWQPVKLVITPPVAVNDLFIKPALDGLSFDVGVRNGSATAQEAALTYQISSASDRSVLYSGSGAQPIPVPANGTVTATINTPKLHPKLWTPESPNLYRLEITLTAGDKRVDRYSERFGFRTFTVSGSRLLLNGRPYWLRGGNHIPTGLRPNDAEVARKFIQLAHDGNVRVTRTTGSPLTEAWADVADEVGLGVSFEGIWPWMMLEGPPPDKALLDIWRQEWTDLIRKYRNHPSVLIWTVKLAVST